jgi:two-component system NtrC family sensor kinase
LPLPSTQVRQILLNLLLNAVHASHNGGTAKCDVTRCAGTLLLTVQNDGVAISAETMEHLFEPFYSAQLDGHGLGLWVTYQLVEQLGGHITVGSALERTTFSVTMPFGG